jgi:hypothetical protein
VDDWHDYIRSKLVSDINQFVSINNKSTDPIVIDSYVSMNESNKQTVGCVVSCKKLIHTFIEFLDSCGNNGLDLAIDGTYKLIINNWVIIVLGTRYLSRSSDENPNTSTEEYTHSFVPFVFGLCQSESKESFECLFNSLYKIVHQFYPGKYLKVHSIIMDHSAPCRSGAVSIFGEDVIVLSCWVHVLRNCKKHKSLLTRKEYYTDIQRHVHVMHKCSTSTQFDFVSKSCVDEWIKNGQIEFANWFKDINLTLQWRNWFVGAAQRPGVPVENNSL